MEPQFKPKLRIQQLLAALPERYNSIKDAIDVQQSALEPDQILQLLREREETMNPYDTAIFAKGSGGGRIKKCKMCDKDHWTNQCPDLLDAKKALSAQRSSNRV